MAPCGPSKDQSPPQSILDHSETAEKVPYSALRSVKAHFLLWLTALAGLGADQFSKQWAVKTIGSPPEQGQLLAPDAFFEPIVIIENYLRFATVHNTGAVAGTLAGKTILLIAASIAALVFLFWLFATSRCHQWLTHIALGMLLAGALGNMYDRLFNQGRVIDFIEVDLHVWPANPWPTFNIADILLCVGVGVLLLGLLIGRPRSAARKNQGTAPPPC